MGLHKMQIHRLLRKYVLQTLESGLTSNNTSVEDNRASEKLQEPENNMKLS